MNKTVPTLHPVDDDEAPELTAELQLAMADVAALAREGLLAMSVGVGLRVMVEMMEAELTDKVGPKHAKIPGRTASRHASASGSVVLGGRRVPVSRPRARTVEGTEVALDTYATFASDDLLRDVVLERMLAGVATRRHRAVAEPVGAAVEAEARSTSRSSVSRRFKAATASALEDLMARDLGELAVAAMMIDGVMFAGQCCVVALAICTDGSKVPVGLWLGDTENKTVVTHLLADLSARGLDSSGGLLFVLDGSKALAAGVAKVFGDAALIQRCTLHKRRIDRPSGTEPSDQSSAAFRSIRRRCRSRAFATRSWRAVSSLHPRSWASSRRAVTSASWPDRTSWRSGSGTKLSHCSQMLA